VFLKDLKCEDVYWIQLAQKIDCGEFCEYGKKILANFDKLGHYYLLKDSGSFTRVISSLVSTVLPDWVGYQV
jgi:hypothetical protein